MGFLGIYKAIYDYAPQGEGELTISEGDILYVLEKSTEDDWWKAKKKATEEADDEPVGLIPSNYIEEAQPTQHARALYDYTRQTDEELSFKEESKLQVFDTSDPDWILVGLDGDYGFAPANYIELGEEDAPPTPSRPLPPRKQVSEESEDFDEPESPPTTNPAAALAGVLQQRERPQAASPPPLQLPPRPQYTPEDSDEEATPSLPARPQSQIQSPRLPQSAGPVASPPHNRVAFAQTNDDRNDGFSYQPSAAGGFHLYNVNEMVSVMGKKRKMPTTLGINLATGVITIAPEKTRDGPQQEWTAEKMTHYSIEGKHIFIELVRPSKSIDFHAGSKDTAQEIVAALGEMAGAVKAEGLKEVWSAAAGNEKKKGQVLYDFMAQGDDEVTVAVGDEVIILDDTKSEEWWQVKRLKNGKEGVVPSSYIEITGTIAAPPEKKGVNAGRSIVEQNRLEEQRLAKEALKAGRQDERGSEEQRSKRESRSDHSKSKSKPDQSKVRTWTDRSKSFSVEAQFLALKDGKINLHKMNGVKIAVPVSKMSIEDLEYVERMTGVSLDEDKPLSAIKKSNANRGSESPAPKAGVVIEKPQKPEYDWFNFFLACDIGVGLCERYSQVFNRDNMDESVLPDVDASVLRNLGLREGDILKVVRYLDIKYNRKNKKGTEEGEGGEGGLFSGPGGALRNNTRKGRPAPAIQTGDTVDPNAFTLQNTGDSAARSVSERNASPATSSPPSKATGGFDDDAWDVKPAKQQATQQAQPQQSTPAPQQPPPPTLTGSMQELSLLSQPLQPTKIEPAPQPQQTQQTQQQQAPQQAPQPTGASPSFFSGLPQQQTGLPAQPTGASYQQGFQPQQNFLSQQSIARQRPAAPQYSQGQGSLMPPPPPRPLSAPQSAQQSAFGPPPLQPQMTGIPHQQTGFQSIAPPGQSLAEMSQMRMQQQYNQQMQQMQPQMTGYQPMMAQPTGFAQNGFQPQQTGFQPQQTGFSSFMPSQPAPSPFADHRGQQFSPMQTQPTGFQNQFMSPQQYPQQTGVNNFLPPALQPQQTGASFSQSTGVNGFGQQPIPPMPPMPQQAPAPLLPQKTGPPPPVRFGVTPDVKKITPQPTGRRANLAAATPDNPFGF